MQEVVNRACDLGRSTYETSSRLVLINLVHDKSTASRSTNRFENSADEFEVPRYTLLAWDHGHIYIDQMISTGMHEEEEEEEEGIDEGLPLRLKARYLSDSFLNCQLKSFPQKPRSVKDLVDKFYIAPRSYFITSSNWVSLYDRYSARDPPV